jgi:hypothetical protein
VRAVLGDRARRMKNLVSAFRGSSVKPTNVADEAKRIVVTLRGNAQCSENQA